MEYSIKPAEDGDYIILKIVGEFVGKEIMQCIIETHALGMEKDIHRYLVDATQARNVDSVLGTYDFAYVDMRQTAGIDPLARVAGLVSPGDHSHDFVATVSANAGMHLELFTDHEQALKYLNAW